MKNQKIVQALDSIEPDNHETSIIFDKINRNVTSHVTTQTKTYKPKMSKLLIPIAACLVIAITAVVQLKPFDFSNKTNQESSQHSDDSVGYMNKDSFKGFTLTAYAAKNSGDVLTQNYIEETLPTELKPNVDILLAVYSPAMNSVPGLPFTFSNKDKDYSMKVSVSQGEILKWDTQKTYNITQCGKETVCESGETLYWSPLNEFDYTEGEAKITVTAMLGSEEVGYQVISITSDNHLYRAKVGNFEYLK